MATVGGIVLSMAAAYLATQFNNIMDILQLVFGFVNAPCSPPSFWVCSGGAPPDTGPSSGCWPARSRRSCITA